MFHSFLGFGFNDNLPLEKYQETLIPCEATNDFHLMKWFGGLIIKKNQYRPIIDLKGELERICNN